jgi:hypothetical protein
MRRGFDGLCAQIEGTLKLDPYGVRFLFSAANAAT